MTAGKIKTWCPWCREKVRHPAGKECPKKKGTLNWKRAVENLY